MPDDHLPAGMTTGQQHIERLWICMARAEKEDPIVSRLYLENRENQGLGDLGNETCLLLLLMPSVRCAGKRAGEQGVAQCRGKSTGQLQSNLHSMLLCHCIKQKQRTYL